MSLINKVLQDLDQRSAMSAPDGQLPPRQVRAIPAPPPGREWFWRVVAVLITAALGWVGWIAYQLQPRNLATELGYKAGEEARQKTERARIAAGKVTPPPQTRATEKAAASAEAGKSAAAPAKPPVPTPSSKPAPLPEAPMPALAEAAAPAAEPAKPPATTLEIFKLAFSIETPITQRPPTETPSQAETSRPPPANQNLEKPPAPAAKPKPPAQAAARLEKREQPRTSAETAEAEFRRAAALVNQGRISEAAAGLTAALALDPAHEAARQTLVAVLIENRRFDEASRLLQDGLAANPGNARFAMVLARIHAERGDNALALEVLEKAKSSAQGDAEFNPLLGAILQRMSRHDEAAQAYRAAVHTMPESGIAWVGLGISLEALQRRTEAGDAFRRAVGTGSLNADVKTYAEQRARQLR
jgi:MSHA biogenesis protein MshN